MIYGSEGGPQRQADTAILTDALLIECRPAPATLRALKPLRGDPFNGPWVQPGGHTGEFPGRIGKALGGGAYFRIIFWSFQQKNERFAPDSSAFLPESCEK